MSDLRDWFDVTLPMPEEWLIAQAQRFLTDPMPEEWRSVPVDAPDVHVVYRIPANTLATNREAYIGPGGVLWVIMPPAAERN